MAKIEIEEEEYLALKRDQIWLICLEGAGVDNWEGYEYAQEMFEDYLKGEE